MHLNWEAMMLTCVIVIFHPPLISPYWILPTFCFSSPLLALLPFQTPPPPPLEIPCLPFLINVGPIAIQSPNPTPSRDNLPSHRENSPVTQTSPEPTLLSWGGGPREKIPPYPWPHGKPGLIALIGPIRPYCSQSPLILLRCVTEIKFAQNLRWLGNWHQHWYFQHIAYQIKSWMEFLGPILAKLH